jgi:hypothetical protein
MSTKEILQSLLLIFLLCASFCVMEIDTQSEDVSDLNGDYCRQKWSCDVPDIDDRNCKCDSHCTLFNDCCVDINNTSQTLRTHVPKFSCEYNFGGVFICSHLFSQLESETQHKIINLNTHDELDFMTSICVLF